MSISTQLIEYVSRKSITVGANKTPAVQVTYKRLDGDYATKEGDKLPTINFLTGKLAEDSATVFGKLKTGDKVVLVKEKNGEYWNFKAFKDASTWVEKPKKSYSGATYQKKEFDQVGVKVGAARNQAIAILAGGGLLESDDLSLDDVLDNIDALAMKIVSRQAAQEALVRSGMDVAPTTEENFTNDTDTDEVPF